MEASCRLPRFRGWRGSSLLTASYVDTPVVLTSVDRSVGWAERQDRIELSRWAADRATRS